MYPLRDVSFFFPSSQPLSLLFSSLGEWLFSFLIVCPLKQASWMGFYLHSAYIYNKLADLIGTNVLVLPKIVEETGFK
ncbi:hypothetical protein BJY01DRAFT_147769 [Aspergillus pseudoustus]|uniref:Uncharacterized protein n=1 Tax=Aspergillus pseudoustus TaxID=1810923 RepID=A0ABR4IF88_9EURO